jgi:hypothetical protein
VVPYFYSKKLFWNLLTSDWIAIYAADPSVFIWFRALIWKLLKRFKTPMLTKLLKLLLPWRRELQRKIFTEVNYGSENDFIDFTISPDVERVVVDDYVSLFLIILIEVVKRSKCTFLKC